MASFETPYLLDIMSSPAKESMTKAAFAAKPATQLEKSSPLLASTPPAVARTLSRAYPFVRGLNRVFGLLTWTSGDPWASFLLVAAFWLLVLYGSTLMHYFGSFALAGALYASRQSVTASSGPSREKERERARPNPSLDEIVSSVDVLTTRLHLLVSPLSRDGAIPLTPPERRRLLLRTLMSWPLWVLGSTYLVSSRTLVLVAGTAALAHHSVPVRTARTVLWKSRSVRVLCSLLTGLDLVHRKGRAQIGPADPASPTDSSTTAATTAAALGKVNATFTYVVYENQRRWIGIGWTSNLFGYERAAWTDEFLDPTSAPEEYILPRGQGAKWVWKDAEWKLDGDWMYYDNKWSKPSAREEFGKYTRRRKWVRNAELVETSEEEEEEKKEEEEEEKEEATHETGVDAIYSTL